jgi:hypothetical protein
MPLGRGIRVLGSSFCLTIFAHDTRKRSRERRSPRSPQRRISALTSQYRASPRRVRRSDPPCRREHWRRGDARAGQKALTVVPVRNRTHRTLGGGESSGTLAGRKLPDRVGTVSKSTILHNVFGLGFEKSHDRPPAASSRAARDHVRVDRPHYRVRKERGPWGSSTKARRHPCRA